MSQRIKGRLIARSIAESDSFASLSQWSAVLFLMLLPHLDNYGKMQGNPYLVKGLVCPKVTYLSVETIERALHEISRHTDLKYFNCQGIWYLHALHFEKHQSIRKNRRGDDVLPNYPGDGSPPDGSSTQRGPMTGVVQEYSRTTPVKGRQSVLAVPFKPPHLEGSRLNERT